MLANSPAMGFVGVSDFAKARAFYEGVLGLTVSWQDDFAIVATSGGVTIRITKPPVLNIAPYTVLGFSVSDIEEKVAALTARGVSFERFPFLGDTQNSAGVWTSPAGAKVAWFKDPDGNLLSLSQNPG